ncbi:MAG: hypothetical protein ABIH89_01070 [Elusimicrobiota bacterium]
MSESEILNYKYNFKFKNGMEKEFDVKLDAETLNLIIDRKDSYAPWTELKNFRCPCCPLDESKHKYCPVITNLLDVIGYFKDSISYEEAEIKIQTADRTYIKNTSLQNGLNSLIGIYMPTSGCPLLGKLKPMVRFHLPFATLDETNFRMVSMYLFAQYFIFKKSDKAPDWELRDLVKIYNDIRQVNKNFCDKLSDLKVKDAAINALVTLDCFAFSVSYSIDTFKLNKIEQLFNEYL